MRVWLDPNKLQARSLTPQDVVNALQAAEPQVAAGQIGMPPAPTGRLSSSRSTSRPARRSRTSSRTSSSRPSERRRSLACATSPASSSGRRPTARSSRSTASRQPASRIYQLPEANALDVADEVERRRWPRSQAAFPQGLDYAIPFDTTTFVSASITEVYKTLFEAGDPGADRHPGVPAGLAGHAGAGDDGAGHDHRRLCRHGRARFHRQPLTLFALVLAIGIVVDDAIVVVEGAAHHIERGKTPRKPRSRR